MQLTRSIRGWATMAEVTIALTPVAVAGALVAPVGALAASSGGRRAAAVATREFGQLLRRRYGAFSGYWACPAGQRFGSRISCRAELRRGGRWYSLFATAEVSRGRIALSRVRAVSWVRRWSRYSGSFLRGFDTPGTASVNTRYEDWAFIAAGAYAAWSRSRRTADVDGYDGPGLGLARFIVFRCRIGPRLVTCANSFGDAIRYRPQAR